MPNVNATGATVLVVDDNPNNLAVLTGMLEEAGYEVRAAINGKLALRAVAAAVPDVVLLDIRMPEMDGYEVCRRLRAEPKTHDVPVIFISALQETEDKVRAFTEGGNDYVTKPFQVEEVLARVRTHAELGRSRRSLRRAYEEMEARAERKSRELVASREEQFRIAQQLKSSLVQTIEAISLALEKRDPYTAGHQRNVAELAAAIAAKLGLEAERVEGIRLGSLIHDIGKIYVPAEILTRPGRLSEEEFSLIRTHSQVGYDIVKGIDFPWPVAELVLQHHERLDGTGYPHGIGGEEVLLESRIVAVADVIDAMSAHRPYRPALGLEKALGTIAEQSGRQFDAEVVAAAAALIQGGEFDVSRWDTGSVAP